MTLRPFILIQTASLLVAYSAPVPAVEAGTPLPILALTKDDTIITQSCLVTIAPGTVIEDLNRNGVIQISADHVTVRFQTVGVKTILARFLERA